MISGNTSGLLGYWDDSQELEYLRPDGKVLQTNSTLEEIHRNFGQLCKNCQPFVQFVSFDIFYNNGHQKFLMQGNVPLISICFKG